MGDAIYVVGGFLAPNRNTAAVERYDIAGDTWKRVRSMPLALNHAAAVSHRGDLFVSGGYSGPRDLQAETDVLLRYDPERDRWSRLPPMPTKRAALAAGVIGGRLYAVGGVARGNALATLESYDFRTRRWRREPSMPTSREHLAGTVAGARLYALAGRASGTGNLKTVERFDPRARRWEKLPDMEKARGGIAAATVSGDRVAVFGGEESSGTIAAAELFDPASRAWTRLPDLPTPRHGLGGVAKGNRVYALEGGTSPGFSFSAKLEALDVR
ncbi:MAG: galactose oxidase [Thermoleophilaceae bacterium]|nr:galactose oxidase [Thermoleophilaceae bacterium]